MKENSRRLWKVATVTFFNSPCWIATDRLVNSTHAVIATDLDTKHNSRPKQDARHFEALINIANNKVTYVRMHNDDHCFQLNRWRVMWLVNWHGPSYASHSLCQLSGDDHRHSDILCSQPWTFYRISHCICGPCSMNLLTVSQTLCIVVSELITTLHYYCREKAILHLFNSLQVCGLYIPTKLIKLNSAAAWLHGAETWETKSIQLIKKFPILCRTPEDHCHFHNQHSLNTVLQNVNSVQNSTPYSIKIPSRKITFKGKEIFEVWRG
jgi:hypothetical protein